MKLYLNDLLSHILPVWRFLYQASILNHTFPIMHLISSFCWTLFPCHCDQVCAHVRSALGLCKLRSSVLYLCSIKIKSTWYEELFLQAEKRGFAWELGLCCTSSHLTLDVKSDPERLKWYTSTCIVNYEWNFPPVILDPLQWWPCFSIGILYWWSCELHLFSWAMLAIITEARMINQICSLHWGF